MNEKEANNLIQQYKNINFKFEEGEELKSLVENSKKIIKDLLKEATSLTNVAEEKLISLLRTKNEVRVKDETNFIALSKKLITFQKQLLLNKKPEYSNLLGLYDQVKAMHLENETEFVELGLLVNSTREVMRAISSASSLPELKVIEESVLNVDIDFSFIFLEKKIELELQGDILLNKKTKSNIEFVTPSKRKIKLNAKNEEQLSLLEVITGDRQLASVEENEEVKKNKQLERQLVDAGAQIKNKLKKNKVLDNLPIMMFAFLADQLVIEIKKEAIEKDTLVNIILRNYLLNLTVLEEFPVVSTLIGKGKLTISKVLKFPHGPKFREKLLKIEEKHKPKEVKKIVLKKEIIEIDKVMEEIDDFSLDTGNLNTIKFSKAKEHLENLEKMKKQDELTERDLLLNYESDDSLASIDDVKFSPTRKEETKQPEEKQNIQEKKEHDTGKYVFPLSHLSYDPSWLNRKRKRLSTIFFNPIDQRKSEESKELKRKILLKMWDGELEFNNMEFNLSMTSFTSLENFKFIDQIDYRLVVSSRAKTKEVMAYVEKNIASKSKIVVAGWIELKSGSDEVRY